MSDVPVARARSIDAAEPAARRYAPSSAGQTVALGRIESPTPPSASPRIVCTGTIVAELPSGVAASGYMPGYG